MMMIGKIEYRALTRRDRAIIRYKHSGFSYKEIAFMYELTTTKVKKIRITLVKSGIFHAINILAGGKMTKPTRKDL